MNKVNEVLIYLLEHNWYGKIDRNWSDETDQIIFENLDNDWFEIWIEFEKESKKIVKVSIVLNLEENDLKSVYNRVELEDFIKNLNVVKKALDKLENELVKPMCENFDLPFVNEKSFHGKYGYLDVRDLEAWLENENN